MSDLRQLLADAGAWIASSEAPGSAEVAAEIEARLAATPAASDGSLDVERLTVALWGMRWDPDAARFAAKIATEYARLSESPSEGKTE